MWNNPAKSPGGVAALQENFFQSIWGSTEERERKSAVEGEEGKENVQKIEAVRDP